MQFNRFNIGRLPLAALSLALFGGAASLDFNDVASQAVAQNSPTKAYFDRSLFEIPEGESGEFYLERLSQLEAETKSVGRNFEYARKNSLGPKNTLQPIPAPADSLEAQIFAAVLKTERRALAAADLSSSQRARYFNAYVDDVCAGVRDASQRYALLQELLEEEETRESVVLSRVLRLRQTLAYAPISNIEPSADAPDVDAASLQKLLDVPEGESVSFYRERFAALVAARWQIAGLDDARSASLPAFYLDSRAIKPSPQDRRDVALGQIHRATEKISSFLADAKELPPAEGYYHFQRDIYTANTVERLTEILAREKAREATNAIDKRRVPFVRCELARLRAIRLDGAVDAAFLQANPRLPDNQFWKSLTRDEQEGFLRARRELDFPIPQEVSDELASLADEIVDLVETGGLSPNSAEFFVEQRLVPIDKKTATRVRQAILATFPAALTDDQIAESFDAQAVGPTAAQKILYDKIARLVAQASFVGSVLPLEGRNLDGTPFDWAAYRGAPVLVEIFRANEQGRFDLRTFAFDQTAPDAVAKYAEAGLKIVRYGVGDFEKARRHAEALRQDPKLGERYHETDVVDPNWPIVGPPAEVAADADWPARFGLDQFRCWVLVDAEGRVAAVKLPSWNRDFDDAPQVDKALKRLYPNVDAGNSAKSERPLVNPWGIIFDF